MAQACDKYTKTALMGNWYEERLAPEQDQRNPDASITTRGVEECISIPGDQGQIIPLPRVSRRPPWITQDIVADDGFREFRSVQNTTFDPKNIQNSFGLKDCRSIIKTNGQRVMYPECNPYVAQTGGVRNYKMLQQQNLSQIEKPRPVHENMSDFGSTFKAHPQTHNKFFGQTTYEASFANGQKSTTKNQFTHPSGVKERDETHQGMKMTSVLTGEKHRDQEDPKDNTAIQRAWLHSVDPGIIAVEKNLQINNQMNTTANISPQNPIQTYKQNISQQLPYDIATSLPIGEGAYSLQKKYNNPGEFRHIRTDVTIIPNKPLTKK